MALSSSFKLIQLDKATIDLDDAVNYYNSKQAGLGKQFYLAYKKTLKSIQLTPYYRVFYDDVHCLQVGKFPYLIHYTINLPDRLILIEAIICTYKDPDNNYLKK